MATITEDYVSFETAKLLVRKGFDFNAEYESYYTLEGVIVYFKDKTQDINIAPRITLQIAMKWLREVHKKWITITFHKHTVNGETTLYYSPYIMWGEHESVVLEDKNSFKMKLFNSYEEAVEAAIKYCLENLT